MSYSTFSVIVKTDNDANEIKHYFTENFKYFNVKHFLEPFSGFICQANENWKEFSFERFPDNFFKDQEAVEQYFGEGIKKE